MFKVKIILFNDFIGFAMYFMRQWETWVGASVGDMNYHYNKESPLCKNITAEPNIYMDLTTALTDNHDLTINAPHCIYTNNTKPGMDYLLENAHYNSSGKWGITHNGQYKVINDKDYNVKHLFLSSVHNIWGT